MLITVDQGLDSSFLEACTIALGCKMMFPSADVEVAGFMGGFRQLVQVQIHDSVESLCLEGERQWQLQQFPIEVDIDEVTQPGQGPYDVYPNCDFEEDNNDE